jgi:hypothetical protein
MLNRTELDPSDKRDLLLKITSCQAHGAITLLANDFSISRKSVYKARDAVLNAINELAFEQTEHQYITCVGVDKSQIRRAIVALAITSANSIRAIQEQIPLIYPGCRVSFGYIQGVIVQAQQQAACFNKTVPLANIQTIAVDEMFSQGWPVLAGIDLDSGFLFSLSVEQSRDGDTWARVLHEVAEQGMTPAHVVKDGAKGITKGVEMAFAGIEQRDDAFHAVYLAGKSRLKLERKAYRAIEHETHAQKKYRKAAPDKKRSRAKTLDWAKKKCSDAIERYTLAEQAVYKIRMAFCSVNFKTGELVTVEMAEKLFTSSIALLRETSYRDCISVALYLENRIKGLTLATSKTHLSLIALQENYSQEAISLTCRIIERKRKLKKMSLCKRKQVVKEMAGAYYLLLSELNEIDIDNIIDKVERLLQTRHMASSAIEGFNATLRAYLYVRKGVNQGFLDLFQAWHNLRPRRWGRHQGTSAYEVLTGNNATDWLTLLGFPPSKIYH